jgi:hypothetical protein
MFQHLEEKRPAVSALKGRRDEWGGDVEGIRCPEFEPLSLTRRPFRAEYNAGIIQYGQFVNQFIIPHCLFDKNAR